jgi:hypothetical protein
MVKEEEEEVVEEQEEQELENDQSSDQVNLKTLISENGNCPTLNLSAKGLADEHMKIMGNTLRNNKVRGLKLLLSIIIKWKVLKNDI